MNYKKLNIYLGWAVFLVATIVYFITIEDTVSLWDCGEYITAAYKLEVGHPPGAPFFMLVGRLFTFFAEPENVAVWINRLSALSSSLTILFMFWSITALVRKMVLKTKEKLNNADIIAVLGSGFIGGLAYTFSDTFWFSAVEGEVYAMASLFTAAIFWAILKWDEEMAMVQGGKLSVEAAPNRWILLIFFLLGLAIGVHLLGILLVPAIAFIIYFRLWNTVKPNQFILTGILSIIILGFIQEGVIPGSIAMASSFEIAFRNSFGLPFFSGTIFFLVCLIAVLYFSIRYARRKKHTILYNALMGSVFLLIGYGSFAVIVIRSNANTPLDENDPENLVTLHSYLKREQYGSAPVFSGPYWNSKEVGGRFGEDGSWNARANTDSWESRSPFYLRRFVVKKRDVVVKAFENETNANSYAKENGGEVEETYFESNATYRKNVIPKYQQTTIFPRMYYADMPRKVQGYKDWSGYDPSEPGETGKNGQRLPTFGENLRFFTSYQVNWMYFRYFMWNFAGRQNDIQGHGDIMRGNWISGIGAVDNARLGNQDKAPYFTTENPANNKLFFIPLILGIIGLVFHFYKAPKDAFVVFLAFLFTGVAIVVYLNQKTFEPRERDYAYAGSFYFFTIWIGIAVYALYYAFQHFTKKHLKKGAVILGLGTLVFLIADIGSPNSMPATISWLIVAGAGLGLVASMKLLSKVIKSDIGGGLAALAITLIAPLIMAVQGWDDHDRSNKSSAHDLSSNYLMSCAPNGILFTNGDNDTFPLWYMQEVEGVRTDVRVSCLSLMQTDWYTNQMKMRAYKSDPLPIKFTEDQILMYAGNTDQVYFNGLADLFMLQGVPDKTIRKIVGMRAKSNPNAANRAVKNFSSSMQSVVSGITSNRPSANARVNQLKNILVQAPDSAKIVDDVVKKFRAIFELFNAYQNQIVSINQSSAQQLQQGISTLEQGWETMDLQEVMKFVRNDDNLLQVRGGTMRYFPTNKFRLKVNKENAKKNFKNAKDSDIKDAIVFEFRNARILTREEVMMLDILANNDWEREISFSSPGGSELAKALFYARAIKQNGMNFELSPLKNAGQVAEDEMYENLMKNYHFGNMSNPDVLTDYYARRHTSQYRLHFATLIEHYVNQVLRIEDADRKGPEFIQYLKQSGRKAEAEELEYLLANKEEALKKAKKRAKNLVQKSLKVMPPKHVLDTGEPSRTNQKMNDNKRSMYSDGILVDYVELMYMIGEKELAEKLGKELENQYKSVIEFFLNSDTYHIQNPSNHADLFANLNSYFKLVVASNDEMEGNPNGTFAKQTRTYMMELYTTRLPKLYRQIEQEITDAGETIRRGASSNPYATRYYKMRDYLDALGTHYGIMQGGNPAPSKTQPSRDANIDQLIKQQMQQDSVKL